MRASMRALVVAVALGSASVALGTPAAASAATATMDTFVKMSDGVSLKATITGEAPLTARPVIVEFSPYGPASGTTQDGPAYNYLLIQDRGTGASPGRWDAIGPRSQLDVQEALQWACTQPWSNGTLGLNGFSASAIAVYNAMHLSLPCVKTAVLKSGTYSLYRDLLYPGGVNNFIPGLGVLSIIGGDTLAQSGTRFQDNPDTALVDGIDTAAGFFDVGLQDLGHPNLDAFWQQRQFQGDANTFPILMVDSFYDVESPGAFEAFRALRSVGDHLLVVAGHDGQPASTDGGVGDIKAWFDHYLLGAEDGIDAQPAVQMLLSDGSRETYDAGQFLRYSASDWPVPGTTWDSLALSPVHGTDQDSVNNGALVEEMPSASTTQAYAATTSLPTQSDVPNAAFFGNDGLNALAGLLPQLTQTNLGEPLALSYTSAPLTHDVLSAGPAALDLRLASTSSRTNLWAVIADVWPDGSSHPVATARLNSQFPNIDAADSITDSGQVVGPYGDFSAPTTTPINTERTYQMAFWPIGNEFKAGDQIRLVIFGASPASLLAPPAVNTVRLGGPNGSRLLLPVLPPASG